MEQSLLSPLSESQQETLAEAVATYEGDLEGMPDAQVWLRDRGLRAETVRMFRLGGVANPLPQHASHTGRVAIPYLAADGHPVQVRFRCIEPHDCRENHHGKYNTVLGDPARLFNVRSIIDAGSEIHICEGEFDAMILTQCGFHALGVPGARGWKPHWRRLLAGFSRVYVWADPDEAGAELLNTVMANTRQARPVKLQQDVSDTYVEGGEDAIFEALEDGK